LLATRLSFRRYYAMLTGCFDFRYAIADDITRFSPPADCQLSEPGFSFRRGCRILPPIFSLFRQPLPPLSQIRFFATLFASSPPSLRQRCYFRRLSLSPAAEAIAIFAFRR
jgi:hypothetical protein